MANPLTLDRGDALLVVDVQLDFLPGGALGVRGGDAVIPPLNAYLARFAARGLPVLASRDWHPPDHSSFHAQGGPWPPHCVAGTPGAAFAPALALPPGVPVISKGVERAHPGYSAFEDTDLRARLAGLGVRRLFLGGLTTEYCVRATTQDALAAGLAVCVLVDAVCPVEARPGDGARAERTMWQAGAAPVTLDRLAA